MVRKTALVTAMLGAFASQAFGMGLGDIRLNSVLNQPLHAEIELLSPTAKDLAELRVALASGEAYARAGVERVFFHTKLRFEIVKRPNGSAVVKITSREAVREPYLDFLIEATWGSGQVLREYTVLVDPPAMMPAPRPMVAAPAVESTPRASVPAPRTARVAGGLVDGQYHTQPSDTLWSIASAVRPDGSVSMEQVMLGLLKANPDAFIGNNINNLKAGQILRVPSREEMTALSQSDALSEVRQQNTAWRDGRTTAPAPVAAAPVAEMPTPAAESTAPAAPAPQPDAQPQADAQLKLLAPETDAAKTGAATGQNVDELRKELTLAVEAVEAQRQENQDLNTRLKDLEGQIAQLHRLIELKNTEMSQLGATVTPTTPGATPEAAPAQPGTAETMPAETPAAATAPTDAAGVAPTVEAVADTAAESADTEMPAEQAAAAVEPEATAEEATTAAPDTAMPAPVEPPAESTPPAAAPAAPEETGLLATLLANPLLKWGAAGAAALFALLAWMGARRRRMQDTDFQESILAERKSKPAAAPAPSVVAPAAAVTATAATSVKETKAEAPARDAVQSDSSLFTDFAVSDMGAMQNDAEADPVAEADVYLAYGRYQQAEELIRTAINRTPQRNDLKFKLLEVLYAAKNVGGFDAEAEALLANLGSQEDELWQRVKEMGQEMNPGNPLYRSDAGAAPAAAATMAVAGAAAADNNLDFALGNADSGLDFTAPAAQADDNSLDFDMGELASFAPAEEPVSLSLPVEEDFSFDLGAADEDDGDGTLASSDEVATKLDLARAYIEMGDPEGARSILGEVMQEGSGAQKSEAQTLMSQIG